MKLDNIEAGIYIPFQILPTHGGIGKIYDFDTSRKRYEFEYLPIFIIEN